MENGAAGLPSESGIGIKTRTSRRCQLQAIPSPAVWLRLIMKAIPIFTRSGYPDYAPLIDTGKDWKSGDGQNNTPH